MAGNPVGSKYRALPDRDRGTVNARFRVRPAVNDLVSALATQHSETKTLVATALIRVGARHEAELLAEIQRLREGDEKK